MWNLLKKQKKNRTKRQNKNSNKKLTLLSSKDNSLLRKKEKNRQNLQIKISILETKLTFSMNKFSIRRRSTWVDLPKWKRKNFRMNSMNFNMPNHHLDNLQILASSEITSSSQTSSFQVSHTCNSNRNNSRASFIIASNSYSSFTVMELLPTNNTKNWKCKAK